MFGGVIGRLIGGFLWSVCCIRRWARYFIKKNIIKSKNYKFFPAVKPDRFSKPGRNVESNLSPDTAWNLGIFQVGSSQRLLDIIGTLSLMSISQLGFKWFGFFDPITIYSINQPALYPTRNQRDCFQVLVLTKMALSSPYQMAASAKSFINHSNEFPFLA